MRMMIIYQDIQKGSAERVFIRILTFEGSRGSATVFGRSTKTLQIC